MPDRSGLRNEIVVTAQPMGKRHEGTLGAITPLPGTCMYFAAAGTMLAGNVGPTNGIAQEIIILTEDRLQGGSNVTAYASGARCFLYYPLPGDELQLLVKTQSGTATNAVGSFWGIEGSSGKLLPNSGFALAPFVLLESFVHSGIDGLHLFRYAPTI
jgi:hypothetical protein